MAIFGERCARCGARRTRSEFEGVPTCGDCERKLWAAPETARLCPGDAAEMQKEVVAGVLIDRCPVCQGVWLDAGELQLVREAARSEGAYKAITDGLAPFY